jgi:anti-sigma B factor antagonist
VKAFELTVQHPDFDTVQVGLRGPLDLARAYDFDDAMRRIERDAPGRLLLDLRGVEFLDTTGLARLLAVRRRCRRNGRRLVLIRGPRAVQQIFSLAALDDQFETVGDPAEELAAH